MIQELRPVALLMTDVVGSTRLEQVHGRKFLGWLQAHVELAVDLAQAHHGEVLKHRGEGDSLFSAFDRPEDAISCAIAWQHAFAAIPDPPELIKVRMAIDFGEAYALGADFWGGLVNRCARLREVSQGGQILVSAQARSGSKHDFVELGIHVLRDVQEPVEIYQVKSAGLAEDFAPIRNPLHLAQLPSYGSNFEGRFVERTEARKLVSEHRLVSILGPGGAGKTRLGVEVASRSAHQFGDGVLHVDLVSIDSSEALIQAIANRFDAVASATTAVELASKITTKNALIVLDNADSAIEAAREVVASLLKSTQKPKFLVTSREALGLADERRYVIGSLGESAAILLMDRATACGAQLDASAETSALFNELAQAVDGLPLGIELLAPMLAAMSPSEALSLLKQYSALEIESTGGPDRHRSLEGVLAWSFERLTESDQARLVTLGLFVGPFPLEAAAAVWGESPWSAAQNMKRLVEKSLVQFESRTGTHGQYRLLETTAAYARRTTPAEDVRLRFLDYYAQRARALDADLRREQNPDTFTAWDSANAHVFHALKLAVQMQQVEQAMSLVQSALLYRSWRAGLRELTEVATNLIPQVPTEPSAGRAEFLNSLAVLMLHSRRSSEALAFAQDSLADATARGDIKHQAKVLLNLALIASLENRMDEAIAACRDATAAFRQTGDRKNLAITLSNMGAMLNSEAAQDEAADCLKEAIQIFTELNEKPNLVLANQNLAEVLLKADDPKGALQPILISAEVSEELQLGASLSQAAALAAVACQRLGRHESSQLLWDWQKAQPGSDVVLRDDPLERSYPREIASLNSSKADQPLLAGSPVEKIRQEAEV